MFGKVIQKNGWEHKGRYAEENIFVYVLSGKAVFCICDHIYTLTKDNILIIPKDMYYTAHTDTFCEYYFFHFDSYTELIKKSEVTEDIYIRASYSYKLPKTKEFFCPDIYYQNPPEQIRGILSECDKINYSLTHGKKIYIISKFYEIVSILCMVDEKSENDYPALLDEIIDYIKKEYKRPLSLSDVSSYFGISKSYIARLFKIHLNTTALKYITDFKLDHGKELLMNTNMSIEDISSHLGFEDSFYFSRIFKKKFFVSPSVYRKNNH